MTLCRVDDNHDHPSIPHPNEPAGDLTLGLGCFTSSPIPLRQRGSFYTTTPVSLVRHTEGDKHNHNPLCHILRPPYFFTIDVRTRTEASTLEIPENPTTGVSRRVYGEYRRKQAGLDKVFRSRVRDRRRNGRGAPNPRTRGDRTQGCTIRSNNSSDVRYPNLEWRGHICDRHESAPPEEI